MLIPRIYDPALGKYRPMNVNLTGVNKDGVHAGVFERVIPAGALAGIAH